jgi:hypothetical protein
MADGNGHTHKDEGGILYPPVTPPDPAPGEEWNGFADRSYLPWKPGTVREEVQDPPHLIGTGPPPLSYLNPPFAVHPLAFTQKAG